MNNSDYLIIGARGQLGSAFFKLLPGADIAPSVARNPAQVVLDYVRQSKARVVLNCAAFTDVVNAQGQGFFKPAYDLNAFLPACLADVCAEQKKRLVTFSTDYVFNGRKSTPYIENDTPDPLNTYGQSKQAGEIEVLRQCPSALIIRTAGLYSATGKRNFVRTILRKLIYGEPFTVANNLTTNITEAGFLAGAALRAIAEGETGILHCVESPPGTWYEFAEVIADLAYASPLLICPGSQTDSVPRPKFSALDCYMMDTLLERNKLEWYQSLRRTVRAIKDDFARAVSKDLT